MKREETIVGNKNLKEDKGSYFQCKPCESFSDHLSVPQNLRRYKYGIANKCSQNWKTTQVMNDHMKYLLHI